MKKLIFLQCFLSLVGLSQNKDLESMVIGTAAAFNEVWTVYPKTKLVVTSSGKSTYKDCVILGATKKDLYTVVATKLDNNFAIVFGYACGVGNNGLFDGNGEFLFYVRQNGEIEKKLHLYEKLTTFSENNEKMEYLKSSGIEVVIKDKFEVIYFNFENVPAIYYLPKNYFSYK